MKYKLPSGGLSYQSSLLLGYQSDFGKSNCNLFEDIIVNIIGKEVISEKIKCK